MASRSGSTNRWTVVAAIGVTCGVLGLLSAAFHERSQPISSSTSTHPIPSKVGPIGTAFDVHGVRVTLERIIDPATAALSYTFPRAGMRYVALVLDLANTSGTTSTDSPLQDHRDEGRELPTPGRHQTVSDWKVLSEGGVSHVPEAD